MSKARERRSDRKLTPSALIAIVTPFSLLGEGDGVSLVSRHGDAPHPRVMGCNLTSKEWHANEAREKKLKQ